MAPCDTVIHNKKYLFGQCPPIPGSEVPKRLEFPVIRMIRVSRYANKMTFGESLGNLGLRPGLLGHQP